MSKEIVLPNGTVAIEAEYKDQLIDEFNNPYIKALPEIISKEEIVKKLVFRPKIKNDELFLPKEYKLNMLPRIYKLFLPLPLHVDVWNMINTLIRQGYVARNPFNSKFKRYSNVLGTKIVNKIYNLDTNENFRTTAQCGLLLGISGSGKSTTVQRVINSIPQIIIHNEYEGRNFNQMQVTWLKLEASATGSIKSLILQFFMQLDSLLGTNNMQRYVSKHLSVDMMIPIMGQVANSVGLGLIIVDELQHLDKQEKNVMNFFVTIMNSFGVSLLLIGTPACCSMLQREMRIARRVSGSGAVIFNPMKNDKEFEILLKGIWKYQWLIKPTKLTKDIIDTMFEKSQGVCDLVVKLYVNVQKRAIEKGLEEITIDLINKTWDKEFVLLQPMIQAIRSNNMAKKMVFEDIKEIEITNLAPKIEKRKLFKNDNIEEETKTKIVKNKKIKISELEKDDIRRIVLEGKKNNKSEYEALQESGISINLDEILGDKV